MQEYDKDLQRKAEERQRRRHMSASQQDDIKVNPFENKLALMRGNKDMLGGYVPPEPPKTAYQTSFRGMQAKQLSAVNIDMHTSCSAGQVIPDPLTMSKQWLMRLNSANEGEVPRVLEGSEECAISEGIRVREVN